MIADRATAAIHPCGKVTGKGNPQKGKGWHSVPRKNQGLRDAIPHKIYQESPDSQIVDALSFLFATSG
ncbi:hypothetical protein L8106_27636 [Lyngbya sp. PCC 8106]|nr:hypothetical protein L8106_27636 [Lyngbya sp. PCC 8106]